MRRISILLMLIAISTACYPQLQMPELSPSGTVTQKVGFTTIEVYYERPAARWRSENDIFGKLVPWGKVWRTGAGKYTTIAFDKDVIINGKTVSKGKYALFTIPEKESWTIILNTDTAAYGASRYDENKDVVKTVSKVVRTNRFYESLTIDVDVIPNDARIYISWLNTQVSFDIGTGADKHMKEFIQDNLVKRESRDPRNYEVAINYLIWNGGDRRQIMDLTNKGISLKNDRFWYYWKVEELIRQEKYDEAQSAARGGITAIQASEESPERKKELIADFDNYISEIKKKQKSN